MLKIDDALTAILAGVQEANRKYLEMSGGASLHEYGVEPLISATVAECLYNFNGKKQFVTLETTFWELIKWSFCGEGADDIYEDSDGQRVDVAYWNRNDLPEGVVEIKRHFSFSNCSSDIEKISGLLLRADTQQGGTLKWGAIAAMKERTNQSTKPKEKTLNDFLSKCEEEFQDFLFTGRCEEVLIDGNSATVKRRKDLKGFESYAVLFRRKRQ